MMLLPLFASAALWLALPFTAQAQSHDEADTHPLGERAHHGLPRDALQINSIYFGVLPDWSRETAYQINSGLDQHVAIIGDYIYLTDANDTSPYHQMEWHAESVLYNKDNSVYAPSIIPNFPLTEWNEDLTDDLVEEVASFNRRGITVWLRFCYEMNGAWMDYGLDPETYVDVWRQLSEAIKAHKDATDTWLVWAPNVAGAGVGLDSELGYTPYYPGEEHVDIAGLSYYWSGHNGTNNTVPGEGSFAEGFAPFHDLYGPSHPLIISETSASYHYEMPEHYDSNGIDTEVLNIPDLNDLVVVPTPSPPEVEMKKAWFQQLTGEETAGQFPYLTAVTWFNYFKEQAHGQLQDYRIIGSHAPLQYAFRDLVKESTAYQGSSHSAADPESGNPDDANTEEGEESMAQSPQATIVYALLPVMLAGLALLMN